MTLGDRTSRPTAYYVLRSAILLGFTALVIIWDPFGAISTLDRESQRIVTRLSAPFVDLSGREEAVVVLLSDETLEAWDQTWPVERSRIASLVVHLNALGAEAVFLDLFFNADRGDREQTALLAAALEATNTAARSAGEDYFAAVAHLTNDDAETFALGGVAPSFSIRSETLDYPLCRPSEARGEGAARTAKGDSAYPPPVTSPLCPQTEPHPSPALAMYAHYCLSAQGAAAERCDAWRPELGAGDLHIRWPWRPGGATPPEGCTFDHLESDLAISLHLLAASIFSRDARDAGNQVCGPIETYAAHDVLALGADSRLFEGRRVFVGASAAEADDLLPAPVHGRLPGVYRHATAFANLVQSGPDYLRADAPEVLGVELNDWLELILVAGVIILIASWARDRESGEPKPATGLGRGGAFVLLIVTPMAVAAAFATATNAAPMNWIGLALLNLGLGFDLINEDLDRGLERVTRAIFNKNGSIDDA